MVKHSRKKLRKRRYLAAFAITALIFILGFFAGLVLESERTAYLEDAYKQQQLEYSSLQLQQQLIEEITQEGDCNALQQAYRQNINSLESARIRLENFQQDATLKTQEFNRLAREYTHAQIRYYQLAKNNQQLCNSSAATVLYFYTDSEDCPTCEDQAFVLTYLKRILEDKLLVFSFNEKLSTQEPVIDLLENRYNVTTYPTVIINEETYPGFMGRENISTELCDYYQNDSLQIC